MRASSCHSSTPAWPRLRRARPGPCCFARYSLAGALRAAPGALAAAMPDRLIRHFLRVFTLAERVSVLANGEVIRVFPPELTEMQRRVLGLLGVPASAYLAMP